MAALLRRTIRRPSRIAPRRVNPSSHYGLAIVLALVSGAGVISYHVSRWQGVSSLDVILLCFGALNAVLYFGFDNTILLDHIDAVIYTLFTAHATWSLFRDPPWTTQFTKAHSSAASVGAAGVPGRQPVLDRHLGSLLRRLRRNRPRGRRPAPGSICRSR